MIGGRFSRGGDRSWQRGSTDGTMGDIIGEPRRGGVEPCATVGRKNIGSRGEEEWEGGVGTKGEGTLSGVGEIDENEDSKENKGSGKTEVVVG